MREPKRPLTSTRQRLRTSVSLLMKVGWIGPWWTACQDTSRRLWLRGVGHYVILGARLDSFAYRRPDLATTLRIFEVDHPTTQQWKRARLQELNIELPSNLTFIPLDFEQQTLAEGLQAGGH